MAGISASSSVSDERSKIDPAIIAALIGAVSLIIAALIAELKYEYFQRVMHYIFPEPPYELEVRDGYPDMMMLPAGTFVMGTSQSRTELPDDEKPLHKVTFTKPFAIGVHEVTIEQYEVFTNETDHPFPALQESEWERFGGEGRPMVHVSWKDAKAYCAWLGKKNGEPYRLPSEAEWEYAARAGTVTDYAFGDSLSKDQAHFGDTVGIGGTINVGSKPANSWGLHDMHGNVYEWVEDHWHDNYVGAPTDGSAWVKAINENRRALRSGAWPNSDSQLRSSKRAWGYEDSISNQMGFRCARDSM